MSLRRTLLPVVSFVALTVVVAVVPLFVSEFRAQELAYVAIYLVAIIGLNILTGYTGQISLGHGAFMAVGGYTTAILMADHGWPGSSPGRPGSSSGSPRYGCRACTSPSRRSRSPSRCPP